MPLGAAIPAIARILPLAGRTLLRVQCSPADDALSEQDRAPARFVAFAEALTAALSASEIDALEFEPLLGGKGRQRAASGRSLALFGA